MPLQPKKDKQTVAQDGTLIAPRIEGVLLRQATTIPDERGTVCEIFNPAWEFHDAPLVYIYQVTVRPGMVKGWTVHYTYEDRLFISQGSLKWVLYDEREGSPTHGMLNEIYLGELNRSLLVIPRGVFHAVQNVGQTDALFVSMPTAPYNHADPDKHRLPPDTDQIPYSFEERLGW